MTYTYEFIIDIIENEMDKMEQQRKAGEFHGMSIILERFKDIERILKMSKEVSSD